MDAFFTQIVHASTRLLEVIGIAVVMIGAAMALVRFFRGSGRVEGAGGTGEGEGRVACFRSDLGRAILLGLEFLVAADIVNTVAIDPTLDSLAVLAGIVLIRTFLSFSLEVELEGRWPWQRRRGAS
jgi:uncharacterized membrane protein